MDISLEKWLVMALLTIVSIILGLIPFYLMRYTKASLRTDSRLYNIVLTVLSCFGGGVLFSTAALHVLPEVREMVENVPSVYETFDDHFPVAEFLMLCGFALIYLVEEIAHFIMVDGHQGHHNHTSTVARHNSIAHAISMPNNGRPSFAISMNEDKTLKVPEDLEKFHRDISALAGGDSEECPDDKANLTSSLRSIMALIALSFHAIMEGVAIGIQNSSNLWFMFGAVASHKFVISFCMGMEMITSKASFKTYITSIVFFAIVSPIGIVIGSAISSTTNSADSAAVVVIEGLVCGTLLYVVFFEILNRERERKSYAMANSRAIGFIQFISLVVGLVGMGLLVTEFHEHHDDGQHSNSTDSGDDHDHDHDHRNLSF